VTLSRFAPTEVLPGVFDKRATAAALPTEQTTLKSSASQKPLNGRSSRENSPRLAAQRGAARRKEQKDFREVRARSATCCQKNFAPFYVIF
jgi:hypothetical protein